MSLALDAKLGGDIKKIKGVGWGERGTQRWEEKVRSKHACIIIIVEVDNICIDLPVIRAGVPNLQFNDRVY